jgi:hypothetical protein
MNHDPTNDKKDYLRECSTLPQTLVESIRPLAAEYERIGDECLLGKLSPRERTILRRELVQEVAKLCGEANEARSPSKIKDILKNQAPRRLCRRAAQKWQKESEQLKSVDEGAEACEEVLPLEGLGDGNEWEIDDLSWEAFCDLEDVKDQEDL